MLVGLLFMPGVALAQPLFQRCTIENPTAKQREGRVEWMRQCALQKVAPTAWFDTGIPAGTGGTLLDYQEGNPSTNWTGRNMYTSLSDNYEINYSYISKLYMTGTTYQGIAASGHYTWWKDASRKRTRALFPIYGTTADGSNSSNRMLFPHPWLADCKFYFDRYGSQPATGQDFYVNGFCEGDIIPPTALTSGVPLGSQSGLANSARYYTLEVPAGATNVVFKTSGGTGDVDLFVKYGTEPDIGYYDCRPFRTGNNETCILPSPSAGTWHVMLIGYSDYAGVTLEGTWNELVDGSTTPLLSGAQGSEQRWTMEVPAGMTQLTFTLAGPTGATGDADLYVKYGSAPTTSTFDCRPYLNGNSEVCAFNAPSAGTWHVMLRGWTSYSGVTLIGDYN